MKKLPRPRLAMLLPGVFLGALVVDGVAAPRQRVGFQKFPGTYKGGYQIVSPAVENGTLSGPATLRIRAPRDGRSALVLWTNTFYTPRGSYRVTMRWQFQRGGALKASSVEPANGGAAADGSFVIAGPRPITFEATSRDHGVTAQGRIKKLGGRAVQIEVTLRGLPEGEVTYQFSGGR